MDPFAIAQGVGSVVNSLGNLWSNRQDKKDRDQQYAREKADSIEFFNMQNEYNSPQAQMQRLQEAGLNPNRVYGQSSGGAAGSAQAATLKTTDTQPVKHRTPEMGNAIQNLAQYYDFQIKQAQVDNLKAQKNVIDEEALYKENQNLDYETIIAERRRGHQSNLRFSADARRLDAQKKQADINFTLDQNDRNAILTSRNLAESVERVLTSTLKRAGETQKQKLIPLQLKSLKWQNLIQKEQWKLLDAGFNPSDPAWQRKTLKLVEKLSEDGGLNTMKNHMGNAWIKWMQLKPF